MPTELVGTIAATLTTLSFLPQVAKTWQTRSAADFSWIWLLAFAAGLALWLVYGLALLSWPLIAANGITLSLVLIIVFVKWREAA
ncbi:MAG: SemiSWEET transporter [Alphaproteobacteria bacterium]|nr:SemiSWEET transporter [Alphaproteobacteria bacterium]